MMFWLAVVVIGAFLAFFLTRRVRDKGVGP